MKTLFTFLFTITFLSTYAQSCGCIQVLSTPNIDTLKPEQFAFTTDTALVEKITIRDKKTNSILFCYDNFYKAVYLMDKFNKHFRTVMVIEKQLSEIKALPKLFNTI